MPYVKIWIHLVWTTKNRYPFLNDEIRQSVFQHIRENARAKGVFLDYVNGYRDHIHLLISLGTEQTIATMVKLLKGESSHWINQNQLTSVKFQWQHEYFAVGVGESVLERTRNYIRDQEEHHRRKPFAAEFDAMLKIYGFRKFKDDDA